MPGGGGQGPEAGGSARACAERVLVAMSGGVDSSVAAARLVEQGYDVVGATMKLFCYGDDVPDRPVLLARLDQRRARRGPHARHSALRPQPRGPLQPARHPELRERVQPGPDADSRASAATRSPSSATCWPTPMRSTATTSPPATTPSRGTAALYRGRGPRTRTRATSSGASTARWWRGCSRRSAR